jgi:hypothetical protein
MEVMTGDREVSLAIDKGICIRCGQEAVSNCYSPEGIEEYHMSGLCELCYDTITASPDLNIK